MPVSMLIPLLLPLQVQPAPPIVIDGQFDDWRSVPIAVADPADAPDAELDFGEVRWSADSRSLHLLIDIARPVNLQRLDGSILLLLDCDGDPATGEERHGLPGVDVIVTLTPPDPGDPDKAGMGVGLESVTFVEDLEDPRRQPLTPYKIGFTFGPSFASDRYELRIERGRKIVDTPPFLDEGRFTAKLVLTDVAGAVLDETAPFGGSLGPIDRTPPVSNDTQQRDPLARPEGTTLRVMSWNTRYGSLITKANAAAPVIWATRPDVIFIQELLNSMTPEHVLGLLERVEANTGQAGPHEVWSVVIGSGGGDLRTAIACRAPLTPCPSIESIPFPGEDGRFLRTAGAIIELDGLRLLAMSVHLKCCGRIGDESDLTREAEAQAIREAIAQAMRAERVDGVIIAGDLNLVGGRRPLELLVEGADKDGSDLAIAGPLQIDGRSNATWSDPMQPFVPGRLDYVLFSDSALEMKGSFVLDARDLAPRWFMNHLLRGNYTDLVSDHLPVIVDLGPAAAP